MKKTLSIVAFSGVDIYFIPNNWKDVDEVFFIPMVQLQKYKRKPAAQLKRFKEEFIILPPDHKNDFNHIHRRLKLRHAPQDEGAIVAVVELDTKN